MKSQTEAALVKRINRVLTKHERKLRRMRGREMESTFGEWCVWDIRYNRADWAFTFTDPQTVAEEYGIS